MGDGVLRKEQRRYWFKKLLQAKALLCKWSWRFANEQNALWRKTICCKLVSPQGDGILVTLEAAIGLAYGRKSEKNGLFSSRMRSLLLGMAGGLTFGAMLGVEGKPCVIVSPFCSI